MADPVSIAITVALNVASMALTAMNKIEGPRLDDLSVTTADYGTPMQQFYGTKRMECFCFYAENIREEKKKTKTKGGKYTEYKYYGTWANFVADHEISDVLQIWLDRHLVMDKTKNSGPVTRLIEGPFGIDMKIGSTNKLRIYLGTETQQPDPRMLRKIEGREGAGMCPAYLGIAYLMWEEVPLEKFGNRLPQCSVVATRNATPKYPFEDKDWSGPADIAFGATGSFGLFYSGGGTLWWWDLATRTYLGESPGTFFNGSVDAVGVSGTGTAYYYGTAVGASYLAEVPPLGSGSFTQLTDGSGGPWVQINWMGIRVFDTINDLGQVFTKVYGMPAGDAFGGMGYFEGSVLHPMGGTLISKDFAMNADEEVWGIFMPFGSSDELVIQSIDDPLQTATLNLEVTRSSHSYAHFWHTPFGHWILVCDGWIYFIDDETLTINDSREFFWGSHGPTLTNQNTPNDNTFWDLAGPGGYCEYSCEDGSLIRTLATSLWTPTSGSNVGFDRVNHAVWEIRSPGESYDVMIRYLDRSDGGPWTLGQICDDVAEQVDLLSYERNFADLDQEVPGFVWTQGPGKEIVGPLIELFDSDIRPHGWIQEGLKRGQPLSADAIFAEWMVPDGEGGPLYEVPITAETDLARRVVATFADPTMEEQPNTLMAQRNAASVKTARERPYDLTTLQIHPDDMQPLIERVLRREWIGATKPKFRVTPLELELEPGDVRHIVLDDDDRLRCRCTRMKIRADRSIDTEWEVDGEVQTVIPDWELDNARSVSGLFPSPGATTGGRPDEEVLTPISTKGFILDVPLLTDAHDQATPFVYTAAGPYGDAFWPGALVFSSDLLDINSFDVGFDAFSSDERATWGFSRNALGESLTSVIDEASYLDVFLPLGQELTSVSEEAMLADQSLNMAVLGTEVLQFRDAELIAENTYRLTGLIRGVRGTEHAVAGHVLGEGFLLIDTAVHRKLMGASEIGDTDYYKFSTTGDDLDIVATTELEFSAAAHRPYSPAHLELVRDDGTGDWLISWIRRSRIGGSTVNGQDVPLGETSESYRVKIMDGDDVVATYDVTEEQKLYTAAEQTSDWGSAQTDLAVMVCQMSPALSLEGFAAEASA